MLQAPDCLGVPFLSLLQFVWISLLHWGSQSCTLLQVHPREYQGGGDNYFPWSAGCNLANAAWDVVIFDLHRNVPLTQVQFVHQKPRGFFCWASRYPVCAADWDYPTPNTTLTTHSRTHLPPCLLACWPILQIWCHLWSWWGCIPLFKTIMQLLNSIILRTNSWRSFNWLLARHRNVDHCSQILIILLLIHLSLQLHLIQTFQACWGDVVKDKQHATLIGL